MANHSTRGYEWRWEQASVATCLSRLRVHTDARAAESARAVHAHTYTPQGPGLSDPDRLLQDLDRQPPSHSHSGWTSNQVRSPPDGMDDAGPSVYPGRYLADFCDSGSGLVPPFAWDSNAFERASMDKFAQLQHRPRGIGPPASAPSYQWLRRPATVYRNLGQATRIPAAVLGSTTPARGFDFSRIPVHGASEHGLRTLADRGDNNRFKTWGSAGGLSGLSLDVTFSVSNTPADGLQAIQTFKWAPIHGSWAARLGMRLLTAALTLPSSQWAATLLPIPRSRTI